MTMSPRTPEREDERTRGRGRERGVTLVELLVVLCILVALASLVTVGAGHAEEYARRQTTLATLLEVRSAIMGGKGNPGFLGDVGRLPTSTAELLAQGALPGFQRATGRGWRGPYVRIAGATLVDGWGREIVHLDAGTASARLLSHGADPDDVADDIVVFLRRA